MTSLCFISSFLLLWCFFVVCHMLMCAWPAERTLFNERGCKQHHLLCWCLYLHCMT